MQKMQNIKCGALTEFLFLKGEEPTQIHEWLLKVCKGGPSSSLAIECNSVAGLKRDHANLQDDRVKDVQKVRQL